jgi:hypothetical protein
MIPPALSVDEDDFTSGSTCMSRILRISGALIRICVHAINSRQGHGSLRTCDIPTLQLLFVIFGCNTIRRASRERKGVTSYYLDYGVSYNLGSSSFVEYS